MKVEVLENGNVTLDELTVRSSLIERMQEFSNCKWCELQECIDNTEKYMDMVIDQNEHNEMSDDRAIGMIRYFRKIKSILLDFKPE